MSWTGDEGFMRLIEDEDVCFEPDMVFVSRMIFADAFLDRPGREINIAKPRRRKISVSSELRPSQSELCMQFCSAKGRREQRMVVPRYRKAPPALPVSKSLLSSSGSLMKTASPPLTAQVWLTASNVIIALLRSTYIRDKFYFISRAGTRYNEK